MTTKRRLTEDLRRSQDQGHLKNKFLVVGVVSDPQGEYNLDVEQGCLEERVRVPPGSRLSREMGVWTTKQPPFYSLRPLYPSRSSHYDGHDPDVMVARWPVLRFAMTTSAAIARLLFVCERFFFFCNPYFICDCSFRLFNLRVLRRKQQARKTIRVTLWTVQATVLERYRWLSLTSYQRPL